MKTLRVLVLFGMVSLVASSQSKAATDIYFPPEVYLPDLTGQFMDVTYTAGSGAFVASGWTTDYNISNGHGGITDVGVPGSDTYTLSATINNTGNLTGGTLTINGDIGDGHGDTTLLTANLATGAAGTAFGYGDLNNDQFQFLFTVSGGTLENAFGGSGAAGGIIFEAWFNSKSGDHPFTGSWTSNFDSNDSSVGDMDSFSMVPVPEPTSILLVAAGALCMVARRRLNAPRA